MHLPEHRYCRIERGPPLLVRNGLKPAHLKTEIEVEIRIKMRIETRTEIEARTEIEVRKESRMRKLEC